MTDGIILGNGNSRYMKTVVDALTQYPTYQDFMAALIAGTFPFDLNGINPAGWDTIGTAMTKANVLTDTTAEALGLASTATPNDAFAKAQALIAAAQSAANAAQNVANGKAKIVRQQITPKANGRINE